MAEIVAPRLTIEGTAHQVRNGNTTATETTPAKPCANVVVLTSGGGFAEVYIDPDHMVDVPKQGDRILWAVDVAVWNRIGKNGSRYAVLRMRLAEAYDAVTAELAAVG